MIQRWKDRLVVGLAAALVLLLALWRVCRTPDALSLSERRPLAQRPAVTATDILDGSFMSDYESYTLDQFPLRDAFRTLKARFLTGVLQQKDNNGIYVADGYAAKLDAALNEASVDHAAERFGYIYTQYLAQSGGNVYAAVIPDKGYFLAEANGYPAMDYVALSDKLSDAMPYAALIDLAGVLSLEDYYHTDIHWRQEALSEAAQTLAAAMGVQLTQEYETVTLDTPFYGVYCGQSALTLAPDALCYLTNAALEACVVYDYETQAEIPMYDLDAAAGNDPYSMFLGGSKSLLTITNPNAETTRELIVFRDSFASSLVPLLAEGYARITLVDIRYLAPERLGSFVDFTGQDVLFLYSAPVLNSNTIA